GNIVDALRPRVVAAYAQSAQSLLHTQLHRVIVRAPAVRGKPDKVKLRIVTDVEIGNAGRCVSGVVTYIQSLCSSAGLPRVERAAAKRGHGAVGRTEDPYQSVRWRNHGAIQSECLDFFESLQKAVVDLSLVQICFGQQLHSPVCNIGQLNHGIAEQLSLDCEV